MNPCLLDAPTTLSLHLVPNCRQPNAPLARPDVNRLFGSPRPRSVLPFALYPNKTPPTGMLPRRYPSQPGGQPREPWLERKDGICAPRTRGTVGVGCPENLCIESTYVTRIGTQSAVWSESLRSLRGCVYKMGRAGVDRINTHSSFSLSHLSFAFFPIFTSPKLRVFPFPNLPLDPTHSTNLRRRVRLVSPISHST